MYVAEGIVTYPKGRPYFAWMISCQKCQLER